jgi:hypothetical protein
MEKELTLQGAAINTIWVEKGERGHQEVRGMV